MENEIIFTSDTDSTCYIESLARTMRYISNKPELVKKLYAVLELELDLALLSAEKAKSDLLKSNKDSVVKPIK